MEAGLGSTFFMGARLGSAFIMEALKIWSELVLSSQIFDFKDIVDVIVLHMFVSKHERSISQNLNCQGSREKVIIS